MRIPIEELYYRYKAEQEVLHHLLVSLVATRKHDRAALVRSRIKQYDTYIQRIVKTMEAQDDHY